MMLALLAFMVLSQARVDLAPDAAGVESRIGTIDAAASALADRTHDLRRAISTPPEIIERADLVAPGRLRLYSGPIRYERNGQYLPIRLAWTPGKTAIMECLTNTLTAAIDKDGWKECSGPGWSISTRPVDARDIKVKRTDADVLEVGGLWADGSITTYRVVRGGVKESIVLESAPASTIWTYDAKPDGGTRLELGEGSTQVLIKADGAVAAILPRPVAIDAKGAELQGAYALEGDVLSTVFDAKWFTDATYPVIVDPTTSVDAGISVTVRDGSIDYRRTWIKFQLPDISETVTGAVVGLYLSANDITSATLNLVATTSDTADWTTGSSAATLDAYTYTGTLDTVAFTSASAVGWHEWDVLGSAGAEQAIADAYADGDDPVDWTVRILFGAEGSTVGANGTTIKFGDHSQDDYLTFTGPSEANNPYLEITYDAAAGTGTHGSGSVGIIGP